jgi:hypothetical protein
LGWHGLIIIDGRVGVGGSVGGDVNWAIVLIHPYSIWVRGKTVLGWHGPLIFINGVVVIGGSGSVGRSVTRDDPDSEGRSSGSDGGSGSCVGSCSSTVVGSGTVDDIGGSSGDGGTGDPNL